MPPRSWGLPQGKSFAGAVAAHGSSIPGISYYLLILFTFFCFTIKQISVLILKHSCLVKDELEAFPLDLPPRESSS